MAYTDQGMSKGRVVALGAVVVIHIGLGWAFSAGLAPQILEVIRNPMEVLDIKEPVKEEEPPPPPEKLEEIPPYVPPPDLPIDLPPPPATTQTITTQTEVKQEVAPRVVQPAPAPAPAPVARTSAVPDLRRNQISDEDYPSASLRAEEEGVTRARFFITADGRAAQCSVEGSSGFPRLDQKTCELIERRFRFKPATEDGKPVGEWKVQNVKWQIRK